MADDQAEKLAKATRKLIDDLAYRLPFSHKPLSYISLTREQAEAIALALEKESWRR
jgi:hypothetical protein